MSFSPRHGALNLLTEAMSVQAGQTLAIVAEDAALGTYDVLAPRCVLETARDLGVEVHLLTVHGNEVNDLTPELQRALDDCDHVLFMASVGDTLRFTPSSGGAKRTMCYSLDIGCLGSTGCTVSFDLMREIQRRFEDETGKTQAWNIRCPLGTDLSGTQYAPAVQAGTTPDFAITRFPVCAPRPTLCNDATGMVALSQWLLPTGNNTYPDPMLNLSEPLFAYMEAGRIVSFEGNSSDVQAATAHYKHVASLFNIDPWTVHSWHAGMNPGICYHVSAQGDPARWSKTAFANPRYLHFHTCGDYAPGEICWSVFDATISMDEQNYWQDGHFCFIDRADIRALIAEHGYNDGLEVRRDIGVTIPQLAQAN